MKTSVLSFALLLLAALKVGAEDKLIPRPQFIPVQIPGSNGTSVLGINNAGVMVGSYNSSSKHGFVIIGQRVVTMDVPPTQGSDTSCSGINVAGAIVGSYTKNGDVRAFIYQSGKFTQLKPNGDFAAAYGINDLGMIVGTYSADGKSNDGFLWDGLTYQRLDVPGATETSATGINNRGTIVLQWYDDSGVIHSSLYDGSVYTNIDVPGATETSAWGINNNGDVAATWYDAQGNTPHGAIYHGGQWYKFMVPGSNYTAAFGINDQDVAVGYSWKHEGGVSTGMKLIP